MSDVQRFWCHEASNIRCVRELDFDRVIAENQVLQQRLTKVQNQRDTIQVDLAKANDDSLDYMTKMKRAERERDALQQRLTTADQRIDELLVMLRQAWGTDHISAEDCRRIEDALNQTTEIPQ